MNKLVIYLILITNITFSQKKYIIDKETREKIEYATILFYNNDKFINGNYSDENGSFIIPKNTNKIIISCIGYNKIDIDDIFQIDTFELEKSSILLDEIILTNTKHKIGNINNKKSNNVGFAKGIEIGSFIKNNFDNEGKIKSIQFKISKLKESIKYRIHFYSVEDNSIIPKYELTKNNTIYELEKGTKGLIDINIENENIIIPKNGIYITLECLSGKSSPRNKYILSKKESVFNIDAHNSSSFDYVIKNTIQGVGWINYNEWLPKNYKATFGKDYDLNLLYVPSFGLELIELN